MIGCVCNTTLYYVTHVVYIDLWNEADIDSVIFLVVLKEKWDNNKNE